MKSRGMYESAGRRFQRCRAKVRCPSAYFFLVDGLLFRGWLGIVADGSSLPAGGRQMHSRWHVLFYRLVKAIEIRYPKSPRLETYPVERRCSYPYRPPSSHKYGLIATWCLETAAWALAELGDLNARTLETAPTWLNTTVDVPVDSRSRITPRYRTRRTIEARATSRLAVRFSR